MFNHHERVMTAIRCAMPDTPLHIRACANAVRYDLLHGPAWIVIPRGDITQVTDDHLVTFYTDAEELAESGDIVEQVYCSKAAEALREYINGLPEVWYFYDMDDCTLNDPASRQSEPDSVEDSFLDNTEYYIGLKSESVVEALFGETIAKHFDR